MTCVLLDELVPAAEVKAGMTIRGASGWRTVTSAETAPSRPGAAPLSRFEFEDGGFMARPPDALVAVKLDEYEF